MDVNDPSEQYQIKRGDTLYKLASQRLAPGAKHADIMNLVNSIAKQNGISDINRIQAGASLKMPMGLGQGPQATSPYDEMVNAPLPDPSQGMPQGAPPPGASQRYGLGQPDSIDMQAVDNAFNSAPPAPPPGNYLPRANALSAKAGQQQALIEAERNKRIQQAMLLSQQYIGNPKATPQEKQMAMNMLNEALGISAPGSMLAKNLVNK